MKQFLLPSEPDADGSVQLSGRDHHYLARVRRLRPGDTLPCRSPSGQLFEMTVQSLDGQRLILSGADLHSIENLELPNQGVRVHLIQGMPKLKKIDQVVRQAMESGAWSIYPALMDHCIPQGSDNDEGKLERWQRIAREAFQQSGAGHLLEVHPPLPLEEILTMLAAEIKQFGSRGIYCHQTDLEQGSLHEYCSNDPQDVFVVIGPEGGLSDRERAMLDRHGFKPVLLGPTVLRTETAAIFAIAAVRMITWEASTWDPRPRR